MRTPKETNKLFQEIEKELYEAFVDDGQRRTHYFINYNIKKLKSILLEEGILNTIDYDELFSRLEGMC